MRSPSWKEHSERHQGSAPQEQAKFYQRPLSTASVWGERIALAVNGGFSYLATDGLGSASVTLPQNRLFPTLRERAASSGRVAQHALIWREIVL